MKTFYSNKAFTLIELIVALVLFSIILLGILSINIVLNNNNQDYGQKYSVKSQTQITLNQILNNASLATGSATTVNGFSDQGIVWGGDPVLGWADASSFCIHQKTVGGGDTWLCYRLFPSTDPNYPNQIYSCNMTYNTTSITRGAGDCLSTSTNFLFVGTGYSITPSFTNTNGQLLFSLTILNCLNDALSTCTSSGTSSDPANNPEVKLTGSVIPQLESM